MQGRMRVRGAALAAGLALAATGCDDGGVGPEGRGRTQAIVTDAPAGGSAAVAPGSSAAVMPAAAAGSYSGSLGARAQVSVSADGETWIDLGPPGTISLALQSSGDSASIHGAVEVPAGTYTYVRLRLSGARTRVNAGSTIGGLLLTGAADIDLGAGGEVVIVKRIAPFTIRADARTTIFFDMNSEAWMTEDNAGDRQVDEQEVEDACEAETRSDERAE